MYLFRNMRGEPAVTQDLLAERTRDYQQWVESFAANRKIPIVWAEKGGRPDAEAIGADAGKPTMNQLLAKRGERHSSHPGERRLSRSLGRVRGYRHGGSASNLP